MKKDQPVKVAGLVITRQRPGSAKGVVFVTIEDETGVANLIVWPKVFENHRRAVLGARVLAVEGHVQREGEYHTPPAADIQNFAPFRNAPS